MKNTVDRPTSGNAIAAISASIQEPIGAIIEP
jgi:hypothetical protein